jgi:putative flippase GtrA
VPLVRLLPERFHRLAREVTTFGVVGLVNTALDFAVFNGLLFLGLLKANVVSTIVATTSSYLMNRHWTYRDRPKTALRREYTLFFAFNVIGLGIQEAVLFLAKYGLGFHEADSKIQLNLFKCVGVAVAMVFRFWAYRNFVFKSEPAGAGQDPALDPALTTDPILAADPAFVAESALAAETALAGQSAPTAESAPTTQSALAAQSATVAEPVAATDPAIVADPVPAARPAGTVPAQRRPGGDEFEVLTAPLETELGPDLELELASDLEWAGELDGNRPSGGAARP